jgi:acyl carrier protein
MVPAAYVFLETLPLTSSGKVDRNALPVPNGTAYAARGYEAPVGEIEITLAQIWAEVLRLERVGRQDHFFELGGHSLLATQVISRARHKFDLHIPLKMMFEEPNLAGFADYIATLDWSRKAKKESSNLDKTEKLRI